PRLPLPSLHPLPTRRSSDLIESEAELAYINKVAASLNVRAPIALRVNPDVDADTHKYISTGKSENKFGIAYDRVLEVYEAASRIDRKSTRLNSSHVKISYAV